VLARSIVSPTTEQIFQTMQKVDGYLNRFAVAEISNWLHGPIKSIPA
jgi:hypothetical protein